jgi:hypothetical protein
MQYEFNFSPDNPTTPYNTEGGLDASTYLKDGKLVSAQRTGFIEVDSGKIESVRDGEVVDLPQEVVERLEKPQPISTTLYYTQSSVYWSNVPADARNMTNGVYQEAKATGTQGGDFEWIQVDLNGVFDIKGVVIGCDWDNALEYGWGAEYTEDCDVQGSLDGVNWEFLFNTGSFGTPVQVFPVRARARYLRILSSGYDYNYLAVTEFYAI